MVKEEAGARRHPGCWEAEVFKKGSAVFLRIKRGSGVVLRLLFPKRKVDQHPNGADGAAVPVVTAAARRCAPSDGAEVSRLYETCKRTADLVAALLLLVLTAPLLLLSMLLIKLTSRGPVLYTQTRVGRYGLASHSWEGSFAVRTWTSCHNCGTCSAGT
jgi:hypothetical protein